VLDGGGAEERVRPGWEKLSWDDSLPQRFPMMNGCLENNYWKGKDAVRRVGVLGGFGAREKTGVVCRRNEVDLASAQCLGPQGCSRSTI